jgi:hypothetical protein
MSDDRRRAVLVTPRTGSSTSDAGKRLAAALDEIAHIGWQLVAVIDPAQHLEALQMVTDGQADVIVAARPEYFPLVQLSGYLVSARGQRTRMVPRRATAPAVDPWRQAQEHRQPATADHPWRPQRKGGQAAEEVVCAIADTEAPPAPVEHHDKRRTQLVDRRTGPAPEVLETDSAAPAAGPNAVPDTGFGHAAAESEPQIPPPAESGTRTALAGLVQWIPNPGSR